MTAFLTESEVAQLTGIKRGRKRQCEYLTSIGVPYRTNIFGAPIVSRAFIDGVKTDKPAANWQPAILRA